MATAIFISPESTFLWPTTPDCDEATECHWFETMSESSSICANRDSMVCGKRRQDIFTPPGDRPGRQTR